MPRTDIKKRIKDDVIIDERIQILRLHFNYLKTALKYEGEFVIDKSKYKFLFVNQGGRKFLYSGM